MDQNHLVTNEYSANAVIAKLREEASGLRSKKRFLNLLMIVVFVGAVLSLAYERWGGTPAALSSIEEYLPWILVFGGGGLAMARKQLQGTAQMAATFDDKRALAPIIELLDDPDPEARQLASSVVVHLLPKFDAAEFSALTREQRQKLLGSIRKSSDPHFAGIVVGAAKRHGAVDCIAPLEECLHGKMALDKATAAHVHNLIHMALADIRMRVAKDHIDKNIGDLQGSTARIISENDEHHQSTTG